MRPCGSETPLCGARGGIWYDRFGGGTTIRSGVVQVACSEEDAGSFCACFTEDSADVLPTGATLVYVLQEYQSCCACVNAVAAASGTPIPCCPKLIGLWDSTPQRPNLVYCCCPRPVGIEMEGASRLSVRGPQGGSVIVLRITNPRVDSIDNCGVNALYDIEGTIDQTGAESADLVSRGNRIRFECGDGLAVSPPRSTVLGERGELEITNISATNLIGTWRAPNLDYPNGVVPMILGGYQDVTFRPRNIIPEAGSYQEGRFSESNACGSYSATQWLRSISENELSVVQYEGSFAIRLLLGQQSPCLGCFGTQAMAGGSGCAGCGAALGAEAL